MKILLLICLISFGGLVQAEKPFQLYSTGFKNNGEIPIEYSCQGADVSPALLWTGKPDKAKAFALIVTDYDAIKESGYPIIHWVVYNIPSNISAFDSGTASVIPGLNSLGGKVYVGPCPPDGRAHDYHFNLYALDITKLKVKNSPTANQVTKAMHGHVVGKASLVGHYQRR